MWLREPLNNKGLYNYFLSDDAHVLTASGVGGGSLIYSGVNLQPDPSVYAGWPIPLDDPAYVRARDWMAKWRGRLSQIVTKIPITKETLADTRNGFGAGDSSRGPAAPGLPATSACSGPRYSRAAPWTATTR